MKPLDATLRAGNAVAVLVLSETLSGCYYYVPYGYYPYGYYPTYPAVPTATTQQEVPSVAPGGPSAAQRPEGQSQFAMPDGTSPDGTPPSYDFTPAPAYGGPAYYPIAYPYPYYHPYPYYAYGWPGFWWPSVSFSFVFFSGCCGHVHGHPDHFGHYGYYGYYGHYGNWGGHGNWGGGHGSWGSTHAGSNGGGAWGGTHGWSGGGWGGTHSWGGDGHFWAAGDGHGRSH